MPLTLAASTSAPIVVMLVLPYSNFWRGFFIGFWVAVVCGGMLVIGLVGSGSLNLFLGAQGEDATASEFTSKKRRRQGWRIVHGLVLNDVELDHIAVGPGGVLAIESKWRSSSWRSTADVEPAAVDQTRRNAQRVRSLIRSREFGFVTIDVHPVLILWGPGAPADAPNEIEGVHVFTNGNLNELHSWLDTPRLDRNTAADIAERLTTYSAGQDRSVPLAGHRSQRPRSG